MQTASVANHIITYPQLKLPRSQRSWDQYESCHPVRSARCTRPLPTAAEHHRFHYSNPPEQKLL